MHVVAIITLCYSSMFAFGFLFAGYGGLLTPDDAEFELYLKRVEAARREGRWEAHHEMRRGAVGLNEMISHWRTRPEVRTSVWIGLASGLVAVIAAQFI